MGTTSANALAAAVREVRADIIAGLRQGWGSWRLRPGWMLEHRDHQGVYIEVTLDPVPLFGPGVLEALRLSAADIRDLAAACSMVGYARIIGISQADLEFDHE